MQKRLISSPLILLLFSFAWSGLPFSHALAITVPDLYVAEVLVTGEGNAQLRSGARAGLLQVLTRVSGQKNLDSSTLIRSSLRNPAAFYYQYSYESTDRQLLVGDELRQATLLRLHFEPSAVARLLRDAGLPVWGSNRPGVMMWVAVSNGPDRNLLAETDSHEALNAIQDQAKQRGVPLIFPIMDIEDASRISVAEVWGEFHDRIEAASGRYNPDSIVAARIQQEASGRWSGRWSYNVDANGADPQRQVWRSAETLAVSADQLVRNMVDQLANELAERYALGSSRGKIRLIVEDVATVADYASLSAYLEQLTPVLSSSVVLLQGEVAEFELETEGQLAQLVEIIQLDERLILLDDGGRADRLLYRWME